MASTFLSPGVAIREQSFDVFSQSVGLTRLGLVGKFQKGPAFVATPVISQTNYNNIFGGTLPDLPATYVANSFLQQSNNLTVTRILGFTGFENTPAWIITAGPESKLSGSTLAVLRSRANQINGTPYFDQESDVVIGNINGPLGAFTLTGSTGPLTAITNSGITVSLDETNTNYIVKQLTKNPKDVATVAPLYVETIYPHFIREAFARGEIVDLKTKLVFVNQAVETAAGITGQYTDYTDSYSNSSTPWIVSRVIGSHVVRLFQIFTKSDGDSSAIENKISIQNIDVNNLTFDILVRDFNDTDATANQTAFELFSNLTLDPSQQNFIGRMIGTTDGNYPSLSQYISIQMADSYPIDTVPAGFEGYTLRSSGLSGSTNPGIYYKTNYLSGDSVFKTYMGISELGYTSLTQSNTGYKNAIKTLEADLFSYYGAVTTSGTTQIKGFHMENTADPNKFVSGYKNSLSAYTIPSGALVDKNQIKFTVVPYLGFDSFNKYLNFDNDIPDEFSDFYASNVAAYKQAIDTFASRESTDINLFATPGIDYESNLDLVNYALAMVESRADSLYIIDSPRITTGSQNKGTAVEVVAILESTGLDSNYAATYWPFEQISDTTNNQYLWISPTHHICYAIAFGDSTSQIWYAPAGINRGGNPGNIVQADIKLSTSDRDTLYQGRINPIATFIQEGVVIWGQKTLQVKQSSLTRINVRRLLLEIERLVAAVSVTLLFEQNDQTLRDQFLSKVEPILQQIQNQRGLTAFNVVLDPLNTNSIIDQNTLTGKIQLQPTPTAEFISLTIQVLPQGANFSEF